MNWQDIEVSYDSTSFLYEGKRLFNKEFQEVIKFHAPGIAPVKDDSGSYHIKVDGIPLYQNRYDRTFGYYYNRAAVQHKDKWFHLNEEGARAYLNVFSWVGNYQARICTVRDFLNQYYHIDLVGNPVYNERYKYAGDFKDGIACVKLSDSYYTHIDNHGSPIHQKLFIDLGVFHKGFATAKDENGWFHIDKNGDAQYSSRFLTVEPFYNGYALVTKLDFTQCIINELGEVVNGLS